MVKSWRTWKHYPLTASAEVLMKYIQVILKQGGQQRFASLML